MLLDVLTVLSLVTRLATGQAPKVYLYTELTKLGDIKFLISFDVIRGTMKMNIPNSLPATTKQIQGDSMSIVDTLTHLQNLKQTYTR